MLCVLHREWQPAYELFSRCANSQQFQPYEALNMMAYINLVEVNIVFVDTQLHQNKVWSAVHKLSQAISVQINAPHVALWNVATLYEHLDKMDAQSKVLESLLAASTEDLSSRMSITFGSSVICPEPCIPSKLDISYTLARSALREKDYKYAASAFSFIMSSLQQPSLVQLPQCSSCSQLERLIVHVSPIKMLREYIFTLLQLKDFEEAYRISKGALEFHECDPALLLLQADALISLEKVEPSLQCLRKVTAILTAAEAADVDHAVGGTPFTSFTVNERAVYNTTTTCTMFLAMERKKMKVSGLATVLQI